MSELETLIPPPLLTLALAIAMGAWSWFDPPSLIPWPVRAAAAAILFVFAGVFAPRAIRTFLGVGTTVDPHHPDQASILVTTGVYARTRNPMYLSLALVLTSWAVWLGHWAPFLGPIGFVLYITRFQIQPEERALSARFGDDYARYRSRVRRWL